MPVRRLIVVLPALVVLLGLGRAAFALPEALSKTEVACQAATGKALGQYGKARTGCIVKCQKKTPLSTDCTAPFANKTLECVQKADTKLAGLLAKKCVSDGTDEDSCPECYEELNGTCTAFGDAMTAKSIALTDDVTTTVFCDDTGSADGLSKAEAKCQKALVSGLTSFVSAASACANSCLKNERKGKTDGTCNPKAFLALSGDTKTVNCIFKAFLKLSNAEAKCHPPSGNLPDCLPGTADLFTRVQLGLVDIGSAVDVCPAECGDGFTQGLEQCDPPGSTGVCPGNAQCTAQCTCPVS
jgi:hypothetical protein